MIPPRFSPRWPGKNYKERAAIALSPPERRRFVAALEALAEKAISTRGKSDGVIVIAHKAGGKRLMTDPLTGEGPAGPSRDLEKIKVNNAFAALSARLGSLTLMSPNAAIGSSPRRRSIALPMPNRWNWSKQRSPANRARRSRAMERAAPAALLASDVPEARSRRSGASPREGRARRFGMLMPLSLPTRSRSARGGGGIAPDQQHPRHVGRRTSLVRQSPRLVLLLAAIGLAITFGVMGVINMAHGEMVMLGAYTTFVVQEIIRTSAPWLFDWSLAIALPLAFLVAGAAGLVIERGVIRFLYGRPLETLLATWGVSLVLQQGVRSTFGASNREVGNPSWMSGAFDLGGLSITYNRLWIVVFTLAVFAVLLIVTRWTTFGLQMRAVTQNRRMAASMGIRTPWIDAFTFALGSGIAGIAGLALSQIDNVSPNLGQGYIIDSFMVVVFGGVGNIWGTLVGAFTLGVANKFLEPYAGAVLGKILVLVFIILFIQKRPRGLFALRGRAVES